jgi:hypothetical protein
LARLPPSPPKPREGSHRDTAPLDRTPPAVIITTDRVGHIAPTKPLKRPRLLQHVPDELGTLVIRDSKMIENHTVLDLFRQCQRRGDFNLLKNIHSHAAHHLNLHLKRHGAPVVLTTPPWSSDQNAAAIERGPHRSATDHLEFLQGEMADMVDKAIWMVLPYRLVRLLKNHRISPNGIVPQHEHWPRTIVDYTFYDLKDETLRLSPREAMQFGRALESILRQVVNANPKFGPINFIKIDLADGFYRV